MKLLKKSAKLSLDCKVRIWVEIFQLSYFPLNRRQTTIIMITMLIMMMMMMASVSSADLWTLGTPGWTTPFAQRNATQLSSTQVNVFSKLSSACHFVTLSGCQFASLPVGHLISCNKFLRVACCCCCCSYYCLCCYMLLFPCRHCCCFSGIAIVLNWQLNCK